MSKLFLFFVALAFTTSAFANNSDKLRNASELEIEAALVSMLVTSKQMAQSNPNLSKEEAKLTTEQIDQLLSQVDQVASDLIKVKRNVEKQNGNYMLAAMALGFGGELTPLKFNLPKVVPAVGFGVDMSAGVMGAFIKNSQTKKSSVRFSFFDAKGVHAATLPATGKMVSLTRVQIFPTIKLFFSSPVVNLVTKENQLVNFSDLNRRFYGLGVETGWNLRIPFTQLTVLKGAHSLQTYGAWVGNEELNSDLQANKESMSKMKQLVQSTVKTIAPDILLLSINLGVGSSQDGRTTVQVETQKITTYGDQNGSGSSVLDIAKSLGDI